MRVVINKKKVKELTLFSILMYWLTIVPLHITNYLFSVDHYSIQNSSGIAESYSVLVFGWIVGNLIVGLFSLCSYVCFKDLVKIEK